MMTPKHPLICLCAAWLLAGCVSDLPPDQSKWSNLERAEARAELGMGYLRHNELDTAREQLEQAIDIHPGSATAWHGLAIVSLRLGETQEAGRRFQRAHSIAPENYALTNDFGIYLCRNGEAERGLALLQSAVAAADNRAVVASRLGLGICYQKSGDAIRAKLYLNNVLELGLLQALVPMAEIAYEEEDFLSARGFLERFFAGGGVPSPDGWLLAVRIEQALGDGAKAREYAGQLRRLHPQAEQLDELQSL